MLARSRVIATAALLCAAISGGVLLNGTQQPGAPQRASGPDVTAVGPRVGEKVPDFTLPDQHGRRRDLASLMGEKGLVLVFYRSADW